MNRCEFVEQKSKIALWFRLCLILERLLQMDWFIKAISTAMKRMPKAVQDLLLWKPAQF